MRRCLTILLVSGIALFVCACGKTGDEKPGHKSANAWELAASANKDETGFKAEYLNKELRVDNLVTYTVWKTDQEQSADAFAYNPAGDTIFVTGDSKIEGKPVKSSGNDFFFKLVFKDAADLDKLSDSEEEKAGETLIRNYKRPYSVIAKVTALDGNNITLAEAKLVEPNNSQKK